MRKFGWIIGSLVLLAGLSISGGLPASAQAASTFTVSGKLPGGQGPVRVVLYLWPSQAITAALKPGQRVPLKVLASQTTRSGSYKLSVDPSALGVTVGRIVNMEVVASAKGAMDTYSFSRQLAADHAGRLVLAVVAGEPRMAPQPADMRLPVCGKGSHEHYCACPRGGDPDHLVFKKNLGAKPVVVGALYSRARDVTAKFTYDEGQSSSLGVGFSASDQYINFSEHGTFSVSSSSGEDFRNYHGHTGHLYKTDFRYGKYRWICDVTQNGIPKQVPGAWQVQANDYAGGATASRLRKSPDAKLCVPQMADSTFHRSSSKASTFTVGASLSDDIGIDLSSQTGYDHDTSLAYTVGSEPIMICGLHGYPGGSHPAPGLIVAGAP
jgi:hypothetical protein